MTIDFDGAGAVTSTAGAFGVWVWNPFNDRLVIIDSDNVNVTIALMQELVPNEGDAWDYMLRELHEVFLNLDNKHIDIKSLQRVGMFERLDINQVSPEIIDCILC